MSVVAKEERVEREELTFLVIIIHFVLFTLLL
jgi:hypothetical protein